MFKTVSLFAVVALAAARSATEEKAWADNQFKVNGDTITLTLDKEGAKPSAAPKSEWHPTTNSKPNGAKSYAMLSTDGKNTMLVFTEKEMHGSDMPKGDDKIAVYAYDKKEGASLERDDGKKEFTLTLVKPEDAPVEAAKNLEREEEEFLPVFPFFGAAAFLAAPAISAAGAAAFSFAAFPFAMSQTSLSASLEKLGSDLEVMDVPINGLEREEKFFFAPFFVGPAMAAFGAAAAAPLFFAPALAAGAMLAR